jgi:hypothetical protein
VRRGYLYDSSLAHYWLQVLSGNWSGVPLSSTRGDSASIGKTTYVISALIALSLGIGNLAAILTLIVKLHAFVNLNEATMKLYTISSARDLAIKLALIDALPEDLVERVKPLINIAFDKGDADWHRNTIAIHGEDVDKAIRELALNTTYTTKSREPSM